MPSNTSTLGLRVRLLRMLLLLAVSMQSVSCGTILYPERIGQKSGPLDPKVVALDAAGMLLFFVPGAVALIIDTYNGTIFLPPEYINAEYKSQAQPVCEGIVAIDVTDEELEQDRLRDTLTRLTGRDVDLDAEDVRVERVHSPLELIRAQNLD